MTAAFYGRTLLVTVFWLLSAATTVTAGQGWYMLGPPSDRLPENLEGLPGNSWSELRATLLRTLPLSTWAQFLAFDTASACEEERSRRIEVAKGFVNNAQPGSRAQAGE